MVCLVILRVGIGWQLLYEGLWKIDTLSSPTPWTSDGYLKSSQGPMRGIFRAMTGDPDDKAWLDEKIVAARWDSWKQRFAKHYGLDEKQVGRLNQMIDGASVYAATISTPPKTAARREGVARESASLPADLRRRARLLHRNRRGVGCLRKLARALSRVVNRTRPPDPVVTRE